MEAFWSLEPTRTAQTLGATDALHDAATIRRGPRSLIAPWLRSRVTESCTCRRLNSGPGSRFCGPRAHSVAGKGKVKHREKWKGKDGKRTGKRKGKGKGKQNETKRAGARRRTQLLRWSFFSISCKNLRRRLARQLAGNFLYCVVYMAYVICMLHDYATGDDASTWP